MKQELSEFAIQQILAGSEGDSVARNPVWSVSDAQPFRLLSDSIRVLTIPKRFDMVISHRKLGFLVPTEDWKQSSGAFSFHPADLARMTFKLFTQ